MISWQEELSIAIKKAPKIAVLGAGSILCGDDAAGMIVAEHLEAISAQEPNILALGGSTAPENFIGVLRTFAPDLLIFVDAAYIEGELGDIALISPDNIKELSFSTHMLPFGALLNFIRSEINCEIKLLGIKPGHTDFGTEPSLIVSEASEKLAELIWQIFKQR